MGHYTLAEMAGIAKHRFMVAWALKSCATQYGGRRYLLSEIKNRVQCARGVMFYRIIALKAIIAALSTDAISNDLILDGA